MALRYTMVHKDRDIIDPVDFLGLPEEEEALYAIKVTEVEESKEYIRSVYKKYKNGNRTLVYPGNKHDRKLMAKAFGCYLDRIRYPKGANYRNNKDHVYVVVRDQYIRMRTNRLNSDLLYKEYKYLYEKFCTLRNGSMAFAGLKYMYKLFLSLSKIIFRDSRKHVVRDIQILLLDQSKNIQHIENYTVKLAMKNTIGKEIKVKPKSLMIEKI